MKWGYDQSVQECYLKVYESLLILTLMPKTETIVWKEREVENKSGADG